jgi:hypothetical protein
MSDIWKDVCEPVLAWGILGAGVGFCGGGAPAVIPTAVISSITTLAIVALQHFQKDYGQDVSEIAKNWKGSLLYTLQGLVVLKALDVAQTSIGIFGAMTFEVITGATVFWIMLTTVNAILVSLNDEPANNKKSLV